MRKIYLLPFAFLLFFVACSKNSDDVDDDVNKEYSISLGLEKYVQNNIETTITVSLSPTPEKNLVVTSDLYWDGKLIKTSNDYPTFFSVTMNDIKTGEHEIMVKITLDNGEILTTKSSTFFKVNPGDSYQGGIVIQISDDLLNGIIASTTDLNGGIMGLYKYGAYNGNYGAFSLDDGFSNTEKFKGKTDSNYAAIACLSLSYNGYNDWYLPAYNELALFEDFREELNIPIRGGNTYWSSTGHSSDVTKGYIYSFGGSVGNPFDIQTTHKVRPCRKF